MNLASKIPTITHRDFEAELLKSLKNVNPGFRHLELS